MAAKKHFKVKKEQLASACLMEGKWIRRRVETIEFLDLSSVLRTIDYEVDPNEALDLSILPFGTYLRGQERGEFRVTDQDGKKLSFLTPEESSKVTLGLISKLLKSCGTTVKEAEVESYVKTMLKCSDEEICDECKKAYEESPGIEGLAAKYTARTRRLELGCRSLALALFALQLEIERDQHGLEVTKEQRKAKERVAGLILDVRESSVLFVEVDKKETTHVQVQYSEELQPWIEPEDRYAKCREDSAKGRTRSEQERMGVGYTSSPNEVSRESQVQDDLGNAASTRRSKFWWLGFKPWHVALENQASSRIKSSHLNVEVPQELVVSKLRCLGSTVEAPSTVDDHECNWDALRPQLGVADQLGTRAHLQFDWGLDRERPDGLASFVSILIAPGSGKLWTRGALLGILAGALLILVGIGMLTEPAGYQDRGSLVTILVLMPGLLGTFIAINAESEFGDALNRNALAMILAICVMSLLSALGISLCGRTDLVGKGLLISGVLTLFIGVYLGSVRRHFNDVIGSHEREAISKAELGRRRLLLLPPLSKRRYRKPDLGGKRLKSFPPPAMWLRSGEGDRDIPYGWIIEEMKQLNRDRCSADRSTKLAVPYRPSKPSSWWAYERVRWGWVPADGRAIESQQRRIGKLAFQLREIQIRNAKRELAQNSW